ncbi:MAG: proton-conducting transporter membrane subunit [Candidatus Omnitrophota bacterium]
MMLALILFLIFFPLLVAGIVALVRKASLYPVVVYPASIILMVGTLGLLWHGAKAMPSFFPAHASWVEPAILIIEGFIAVYLLFLAFKRKDFAVICFLLIQSALVLAFHVGPGKDVHATANLFLDQFSVLMGLIVGVIGGFIAMYAVGYMQDFHHHHPEVKDQRPLFFSLIFIFLSAMFGFCFSNNLFWMFFFWEITTVCSFLLIRYKLDETSVANAFWALRWNLLGGLFFLAGIIYLYLNTHVAQMDKMLLLPKMAILLPVAFLSFAGMTKSAQLPFSSWLVGAMVAPTPVSALLHSSTMVKAGVYLVLRFASVLQGTMVGNMVALIGGVTFLIGSFVCISQNDAKKVLAYSTIANLGLIILCAGVGTPEAVWAGMLLIVFHAISKGLLFLCVGSVEHQTGSRQIEDMSGLVVRMPKVAVMIMIGIAGMFLAPFGMLISKWIVLRAVIQSNPLLSIFLIFGSAATLFFWVKWLGKLIMVERDYKPNETGVVKAQWFVLGSLAVLTVLICAFFSPVAGFLIEPYIAGIFHQVVSLGAGNMVIVSIMLSMVCMFPLTFLDYGKGVKVVDPYLGGANAGQKNFQFLGALRDVKDMEMKNYYFEEFFGEGRLMRLGVMISILLVIALIVIGAF